jgi:hypothetical protein
MLVTVDRAGILEPEIVAQRFNAPSVIAAENGEGE